MLTLRVELFIQFHVRLLMSTVTHPFDHYTYKPINIIVLAGLLVMAMHFLQAGRKCATLPGAEESMTTTIEFITALFCQVDDHLAGLPKHPEAHLWPSEVV